MAFGKKKDVNVGGAAAAPVADAVPAAPELSSAKPKKEKKAKQLPAKSSGGMKFADVVMLLSSVVLFAAVVIEMLAAKSLMLF